MNLHRRHLWVEMDRPIADHKLCEWIVRSSHVLLFPGSFWHVKPDCYWANAISKALHLTEGAVWHNCQWGHSLHDWEEKIRWWCWGLRAPVAVGNQLQAIALALCLKPDLEADHTNFKNLSLTLKLWPWSSRQYWKSNERPYIPFFAILFKLRSVPVCEDNSLKLNKWRRKQKT